MVKIPVEHIDVRLELVEYIFGWNGLGREIVNSLNLLDVPVIIGAVIVVSFSFIMINIFVDYIYKILDPRIN